MAACAVLCCAGGVRAETVNVWVGGSSGWSEKANWSLNVVPDGTMVAEIPAACAVTLTADEIEAASAAQGVRLAAETSKIVFHVEDGSVRFSPWIRGEGAVEKTGPGTLRLTSCTKEFRDWDGYGDFYVQKGVHVLGGALWLPQDTGIAYALSDVSVAADAVLVVANDMTTYMKSLCGAGIVSNPAPETAAVQAIQVGYRGKNEGMPDAFSGKAVGRLRYTAAGRVDLTGCENEFTAFMVFDGTGQPGAHGVTGVRKIGNPGELSSTGPGDAIESRLGGSILYLGDGETTAKKFWYRTQNDVPTIWDAGATGGIVFTGKWYQFQDDPAMGRLVLTGSNTVNACVLSNEVETVATRDGETVTTYVTKKGCGVWRLADVARPKMLGGFGVDEGTLQFESIAETNVACSLGMATRLSEDYYGAWDPAKATDYAYRLGGADSTNAVFEFVGAKSCSSATRAIALGGDAHLRASGTDGAALSLSGVTALAGGGALKTLTLDGENGGRNVLREVADGAGRVALVKDGPGAWTLAGNLTFSGPLYVRAGSLTVERNRAYRWYRLTVMDVAHAEGPWWIGELGLFDGSGARQDLGLSFDRIGTKERSKYPGAAELPEGKVTYGFPGEYYDYEQDLNKLFDRKCGDGNSCRFVRYGTGGAPTLEEPSRWISFVAHLPATATEVAAYDFVVFQNVYSANPTLPKSFSLEGSADGVTWTMLHAVTNAPNYDKTDCWISDGEPYDAAASRMGRGYRVTGHDGEGLSSLANVESVGVAHGATLTAVAAEPIEVAALQVDVAEGVGTLVNFRLAPKGTLRVTLPKDARALSLPLDFSGVSGLDRSADWSLEVNGLRDSGWTFSLSESALRLLPPGVVFVIR